METYRILQVDPVTVPPGELELLVDAGGLVTTRRAFIEEFTRHRLMPLVTGSTPESEDVLIVRTTVASWDPGDAGARFFIGFVGAATAVTWGRLVPVRTPMTRCMMRTRGCRQPCRPRGNWASG